MSARHGGLRLPALLLLGAALLGGARPARAFGDAGHEIVGFIAEDRLRGTRALREIRRILAPGESLDQAAVWADRVKREDFVAADAEARDFVNRNPNHRTYHYVDLPFQASRYVLGAPGTHPDTGPGKDDPGGDVVQMMTACIQTLRGQSHRFTERQALRLLVHYVGDLHQPLHVGCGYVRETAPGHFAFVDPARSGDVSTTDDQGGNALKFSIRRPDSSERKTISLHGFWDGDAVEEAMGSRSPLSYARDLITYVPVQPSWRGAGEVSHWPEQWVSDSLIAARTVYAGIRINGRHNPPPGDRRATQWGVSLPANYLHTAADTTRAQLAKAGFRLAELLGAIWPGPA